MVENINHIHAEVRRKGRHFQDQYYELESRNMGWLITEEWKVIEHPVERGRCVVEVDPWGYRMIDIKSTEAGILTHLNIRRIDMENVTITFNGVVTKREVVMDEDANVLLLEGPNPMFDYLNAVLLLAVGVGDTRMANVNVIDWRHGNLYPAEYTFSRLGAKIIVEKDPAYIPSSELLLEEIGHSLIRHIGGDEVHEFTALPNITMNNE